MSDSKFASLCHRHTVREEATLLLGMRSQGFTQGGQEKIMKLCVPRLHKKILARFPSDEFLFENLLNALVQDLFRVLKMYLTCLPVTGYALS